MNCRNSSTPNPRRTWAWLKSGLFGAALALFGTAQAQTTLVNENFEGATSFLTANAAATNQWFIGTATNNGGTTGAYVSNDGGVTNAYTLTTTSTNHLYVPITVPAGESAILLSFDWKGVMEYDATTSDFDYIRVSVTSAAPVGGTFPAVADQLPVIYAGQDNYTKAWVNLPASLAGAGPRFLVFTWRNDGSLGFQGPAAIDNVSLISNVPSPLSGTKNIPGDYSSIGEAIANVNAHGANTAGGSLIFNVAAGSTFIESPTPLQASGSSASNRIIFQKSGVGANPVIIAEGAATFGRPSTGAVTNTSSAIIALESCDFVTFDGIDVTANAAQGVNPFTAIEFGYVLRNNRVAANVTTIDGSQNNIIQNCTITMDRRKSGAASSVCTGIVQTAATGTGAGSAATSAAQANSGNIYRDLTIRNSYNGINLLGTAAFPDLGCQITTALCTNFNTIGDPNVANDLGNAATTTAAFGIRASDQSGVLISNNRVRNVSATGATDGINLVLGQGNCTVANNIVRGIRNSGTASTTGFAGIRVSHSTLGTVDLRVYNNSVSEITSGYTGAASATKAIKGIFLAGTTGSTSNTYSVYNNSVSIDGSASPNISNDCIETAQSASVFIVKNNVFANFTGAQGTTAKHFGVAHTSAATIGGTGSSWTNNDVFIANDVNVSGFTAQGGTTNYNGVGSWASGVTTPLGAVAANIEVDPGYVSNTSDLHASAAALNGGGVAPPVYITNDLDCATRTPDNDIGAYIINSCAGATAGTIGGTLTVCSGASNTLTLTGSSTGLGISYQWKYSTTPGGPYDFNLGTALTQNTSALGAGVYYVVADVTCSSGPVTATTPEVTLTVNATPTATAGSNSPVCVGQSLDLTGTTDIGTTFSWTGPLSFTSSSQNPNVSASATLAMGGTYVFTATLAGCTSAPSNTVVVVNPAPIISSTTATPNPTCFNGTSQLNVVATAALPFVRITEITFFRTGTGLTPTYPAYVDAAINDFVELNNTSSVPADISGWTFSDHPSAGVTNNHPALTFAPGTIIPANGVLVIGLGTGVNSPANNYYVTGGSSDFYSSGGAACFVLKNGSTVVDAVATNGATFAGALGVTAGDWSGSAVALSGNAGTVRTAANDSNTGADWTTSSSATQSIGTFNAGYNNPFVGTITSYLWTPNTFLSADNIADPVANGVNVASQAYSVLVTADNGCTATGNVTLTTSAPITAATITGNLSFCTGGSTTLTAVPTDGAGPYTFLWSPNGETTNVITVTAAGSYSCQVSDNCGGSVNTGATIVIENPVPVATAGSNSPVCVGSSLDLTGASDIPGSTFSWTGPLSFASTVEDPQVSASATTAMSGTYVLTATAAGCTSAPSNTVAVVNPNPVITSATATPATICPGGDSQLNVVSSTGTDFMSVVPITYAPVVGSGTAITTWGAGGDLTNDDGFGAAITLPFSFTLDGTSFTQAWVSANGYLTFQDPVAVTALQARTSSNMSAVAVPNAVVALSFADLIASSGTVSTFTVGAPGSQIFVLDYTNVPFFNVTGSVSGQILLYEGTNIIEVHVTSVSHGTSTSPNALGVENGAGTGRVFAPGRSPAVWNVAAPEAWRFAPTSNTISWSPADFLSSTTIANPVATAVTAATTYTVTVTNSLNCSVLSNVPVALAVVDDGDPCTLDACLNGVVTNTFQDADGDLICDANDPCPNLANLVNGDPCNDGNVCTINDVVTGCVCAGTFEDTDSDGVCDANDNCPTVPGQLGSACNDGNPLTTGDVLVAGCICQGNLVDCEGTPAGPAVPGSPCNDNDVCTLNDIWSPSCVCAGTFTDTDSDGICDTNDNCPTFPGVQGDPCTDGDPCTINDVITAGCACAGTPAPVTAGVTASAANYCTPGPGVTLTATGGDTYSWSPATGLSSTTGSPVTATPGTPTTYTVTATNLAGCSDTETIAVGSGAFPATPVMSATPSTVCPGSNAQLVAQIGTTPSYCTATATAAGCTGDEFLSNVVFGSISNPSGCTYGAPNNSYNNFTAQSTTVVAGSVGNTLTASITNLFSGDQMRVWIDWNQDGDFADLGEEYLPSGVVAATTNFSINVPAGAVNGSTRMRVRLTWTGVIPACGSTGFGEVEDYTVVVTGGASSCAPGINFSWSPTTFLSDPLICNPVATAVTAATTYTVTATNASGCFSTNTVSLAVETADGDGDGTADCADGCPADPNKIAPGQCGCGVVDTDTDSDGTADCNDLCPADPLKIAPGICGCGVADTDTDGDLTADCNDLCPLDPNKTAPGACGCGVADADGDGDGIADCNDLCPLIAGTVGTACDDGNAGTINDQITAECVCAGTTPSCAFNTVLLDLTTDGSGSETSWDVVNVGTTTAVCSGSGYLNNQVITLDCCLPDGCYELRVFDSAGDGMANGTVGGYVLRTASGSRIIDNGGDGIFTSTSQIALNLGFCVPLSTDGVIAAHCDKVDWLPGDIIQAQPISAVTAQFGVTNATSGYWYWFFNPDGGYTRRILLTHANPGTVTGAPSNIRASFLRLSDMVTQPLPYFTNLNVRVRRQVAGVVGAFGPACRFRLDPPCSTTQLTVVADPVVSCGATGLTRSSTIYASTVAGANLYQFEFSRPGYTRRITSPTRAQVLNFVTFPLQLNTCYDVRVRMSFDGGQTYCPFGATCTITLGVATCVEGLVEQGGGDIGSLRSATMNLWPNPNDGTRVNVSLTGFDETINTVGVEVMDLNGRMVSTSTIPVQGGYMNTVLPIEQALAPGLYMVNLQVGADRYTERLVIQ